MEHIDMRFLMGFSGETRWKWWWMTGLPVRRWENRELEGEAVYTFGYKRGGVLMGALWTTCSKIFEIKFTILPLKFPHI